MFKVYEKGAEIPKAPKFLRLTEVLDSVVLRVVDSDGEYIAGGNILQIKNGMVELISGVAGDLGFKTGCFGYVKVSSDDYGPNPEDLKAENEKLKAEIVELKGLIRVGEEGAIMGSPSRLFPAPCDCLYYQRSNPDHAIALRQDKLYIQWGGGFITKDVHGVVGRDLGIQLLTHSR